MNNLTLFVNNVILFINNIILFIYKYNCFTATNQIIVPYANLFFKRLVNKNEVA